MNKIVKIIYRLPSGTSIDYMPDTSEVSEEDLSYIIRMVDGETFDDIARAKGLE